MLVCKEGHEDTVARLLADVTSYSLEQAKQRQNGIVVFESVKDQFEQNKFHIWSRYRDYAHLGKHQASPEFLKFYLEVSKQHAGQQERRTVDGVEKSTAGTRADNLSETRFDASDGAGTASSKPMLQQIAGFKCAGSRDLPGMAQDGSVTRGCARRSCPRRVHSAGRAALGAARCHGPVRVEERPARSGVHVRRWVPQTQWGPARAAVDVVCAAETEVPASAPVYLHTYARAQHRVPACASARTVYQRDERMCVSLCVRTGPKGEGGLDDATGATGAPGGASMTLRDGFDASKCSCKHARTTHTRTHTAHKACGAHDCAAWPGAIDLTQTCRHVTEHP